MFCIGSAISMIIVLFYTHLGITPLWLVVLINVLMFVGVSSRMIAASALMTAIPEQRDRGAFMGVNASVQQISGGIASAVAGLIVVQTAGGTLQHYDILGYVVVAAMLVTIAIMYVINRYVTQSQIPGNKPAAPNNSNYTTDDIEGTVISPEMA